MRGEVPGPPRGACVLEDQAHRSGVGVGVAVGVAVAEDFVFRVAALLLPALDPLELQIVLERAHDDVTATLLQCNTLARGIACLRDGLPGCRLPSALYISGKRGRGEESDCVVNSEKIPVRI